MDTLVEERIAVQNEKRVALSRKEILNETNECQDKRKRNRT